MSKVKILDISYYQDNPDTLINVDFETMRNSGVDGVIFRIGQNTWEDLKFKEYWENSSEKGFLRGGYWYYDNRISPEIQAEKCVSILKKYDVKFELPLFADFEDRRVGSSFPYMGWNNWYRFLTKLEFLLPDFELGLYTGYYYFLENCPKMQSQRDYFGKFPLWIAQYPYESHVAEELYTEPKIPKNTWKDWEFWQVSDRGNGHYYGVESSRVDINYYNGTNEDFLDRYGKTEIVKKNKRKITVKYNENTFSYEEK